MRTPLKKERSCAICNKIFYVSTSKRRGGGKPENLRQRNAITCSSKCSKINTSNKNKK